MRFLKNPKEFKYINEEFDMSGGGGPLGNDINWGDSLAGRLFNSIARVSTIAIDSKRIKNITKRIKGEFDKILLNSIVTDEIENSIQFAKISHLLGELKHSVEANNEIKKIAIQTENIISDISNLKDSKDKELENTKNKLIESLKDFLSFIKSQRVEENETEEDETEEDEKGENNNDFDINELLELLIECTDETTRKDFKNELIENRRKFVNDIIDSKLLKWPIFTISDNKIIYRRKYQLLKIEDNKIISFKKDFNDEENAVLFAIGKIIKDMSNILYGNKSFKLNENEIRWFNKNIKGSWVVMKSRTGKTLYKTQIGECKGSNVVFLNKRVPNQGDTNINNLLKKGIFFKNEVVAEQFLKDQIKKNERKVSNYKGFIIEKKLQNDNKIQTYFNKNISLKYWFMKESDVNKIKNNIEKSSDKDKKIDNDHILEAIKLFNKAYKIFTKDYIPSGRTGGAVSNRTQRKYTFIGKGSPSPGKPGYGPWRNNKLFNRFEKGIQDILKEERFKKLFNEKTTIVLGDGTEKKGGGKILLKFINDLLDGDSYYKGGLQKKFMKEYFNIETSDDNNKGYKKPKKENINKNEEKKENISFVRISEIKNKEKLIYAIKTIDKKVKYLIIIEDKNDKIFIKISNSFGHFKSYLNNKYELNRGQLNKLDLKKNDVLFGRIDKKSLKNKTNFITKSDESIKFDFINLKTLGTNRDKVKLKSQEIKVEQLYGLGSINNNGNLNMVKITKDTKSDERIDSNFYSKYKKYFKK